MLGAIPGREAHARQCVSQRWPRLRSDKPPVQMTSTMIGVLGHEQLPRAEKGSICGVHDNTDQQLGTHSLCQPRTEFIQFDMTVIFLLLFAGTTKALNPFKHFIHIAVISHLVSCATS